MGKSMSTAKQVNRSAITKAVTQTMVQAQPNQKMVLRATPMPSLPTEDYLRKTSSLDKGFNDRLKQVFVTSVNDNTNLVLTKERSMPKDRTTPFTKSPHSQMADESKPDKLFVDEINEILVNYKENPEKWTVEYIAARYEISKEITEKLVENYGTLQTFYSGHPSESDKYLHHEEPEIGRITADKSFYETEDIMSGVATGNRKEKKWKTKEEFMEEYVFIKTKSKEHKDD